MDFKWLKVPSSNEMKDVKVVQMWEVRWWSRHGQDLGSPPQYTTASPQLECFTSEAEAVDFKKSLEQAFKLLRYSGTGRDVSVTKSA